jgi:hypothetical protein
MPVLKKVLMQVLMLMLMLKLIGMPMLVLMLVLLQVLMLTLVHAQMQCIGSCTRTEGRESMRTSAHAPDPMRTHSHQGRRCLRAYL